MTAKVSKTDSDFISAVRIIMIFALVIHHIFAIPNSGFFPRQSLDATLLSLPNFLNAVLHWTAMSAVPLLSIVSGFLYFNRPVVRHRELLTKRFHSIVLPSLAWTTLWFIFAYVLVTIGRAYGQFQWLDKGFATLDLWTVLNSVVGLTSNPVAFQFWFIHDLILTLLLAPVLGWLLNKLGAGLIMALGAVWLTSYVPPPFFSLNVLLFFTIGSFLAIKSISFEQTLVTLKKYQWCAYPLFFSVLISRIFATSNPIFASDIWLCLLRKTGVIAVSVFIFTLLQSRSIGLSRISKYSPYSFFIFATHYPIIEFFKIIAQRLPLQKSMIGQMLTLIIVPILTVATCTLAAILLNRFFPSVFAFLNGGRVLQSENSGIKEQSEGHVLVSNIRKSGGS